ncbi:MAG: tail fiber domain-containing protein, partial [Planctomycetota bacterium]
VASPDGWAGHFQGGQGLYTEGFKMPTGAAAGYVLTCDADGIGTWQAASGAVDTDWTIDGDDQYSAVSGNVGIGTATPAEKLDVTGNIHASGSLISGSTMTISGATNRITSTSSMDFYLDTGDRALRLEDQVTSPNLLGGYGGNTATAGVNGATVSGGGYSANANKVTDHYATVGGGVSNVAGNDDATIDNAQYATVCGGRSNAAGARDATIAGGNGGTASGAESFIGGGEINEATHEGTVVGGGYRNRSLEVYATIGGGYESTASGNSAVVAGGKWNLASGNYSGVAGGYVNTASGMYAAVPGGRDNEATASYALAAGHRAHAVHDGTFVWGDSTNADFSSTAADQFLIRAAGGVGIGLTDPSEALDVSGNIEATGTIKSGASITIDGDNHKITSDGDVEVHVSDGRALRIETNADSPNLIGGHSSNSVTAGVYGATISGGGHGDDPGYSNTVTDSHGTIGGGIGNQAGNDNASTLDARWATVAGGSNNTASDDCAAVGGGSGNTASGEKSTVGGGQHNSASGTRSTVGGGYENSASGTDSTVGGGAENDAGGGQAAVCGGSSNSAGGHCAFIGAGLSNDAPGRRAAIPGGYRNEASGDYSFACGRRAKATADGAFAWADSTDADFTNSTEDRFAARCGGGVYFYTKSDLSTGVYVAANDGSWSSVSDRTKKENFTAIDTVDVLEKLVAVPVTRWNYRGADPDVHHMSPVAQDLYAAFGLGTSNKAITTIDGLGISMAAIQGLHQVVEEKDAKIAEQGAEIRSLRNELDDVKEQLRRLQDAVDSLTSGADAN